MYLKIGYDYFILLQKIGNTILLARECLTETVGFALGVISFKSKTGSLPQRCPLLSVLI